ncbi:MAG: RDD family protein [Hyphomicrobiales bacterium]|nr:RDD family protein [Hyphomicrobiales bacterium]
MPLNALNFTRNNLALSLPATAFQGVRTRRLLALAIDLVIVTFAVGVLTIVLALPTLGLSFLLIPPMFPLIAFFYNGLTVSGAGMGTWGMQMMDVEMGMSDGSRVNFVTAGVHAVLFYVSTMFMPVFLISLLSDDKRCLHDMLADVVVTRRSL